MSAATDLFAPVQMGDFAAFPVGTRVTVATRMQDHHFFRIGEPGIVIRNSGRYLGVIVSFDRPWTCDHGHYRHLVDTFNFNPVDLALDPTP